LESKIAFEKCNTWNSYTFPNEHVMVHVWHHRSKLLVGPDIWTGKQKLLTSMKDKTTKQSWSDEKNCSTSCNCFYINKPSNCQKKCKERVNMMYRVYKIPCKENERIYVGQSANPQKRFKRHALFSHILKLWHSDLESKGRKLAIPFRVLSARGFHPSMKKVFCRIFPKCKFFNLEQLNWTFL
jgi:hypothetical protein